MEGVNRFYSQSRFADKHQDWPFVEQYIIINFLPREGVKAAKILLRLTAQLTEKKNP